MNKNGRDRTTKRTLMSAGGARLDSITRESVCVIMPAPGSNVVRSIQNCSFETTSVKRFLSQPETEVTLLRDCGLRHARPQSDLRPPDLEVFPILAKAGNGLPYGWVEYIRRIDYIDQPEDARIHCLVCTDVNGTPSSRTNSESAITGNTAEPKLRLGRCVPVSVQTRLWIRPYLMMNLYTLDPRPGLAAPCPRKAGKYSKAAFTAPSIRLNVICFRVSSHYLMSRVALNNRILSPPELDSARELESRVLWVETSGCWPPRPCGGFKRALIRTP